MVRGIVRPLLAGLLVAGIGVAAWWFLTRAEDRTINRLVEAQAQLIADRAGRSIETHLGRVERMARRWEQKKTPNAEEWKSDVLDVKRETPALRAIEWRDAAFDLRWAAPLTGLGAGGDLDSSYEDRRRSVLSVAASGNEPYVSATFFGNAHHRHLALVVPMFEGDLASGYLVAVARVRDVLDQVMQAELKQGYSVAVHEGPYLVYGPPPTSEGRAAERFSGSADVEIHDLKWRVEVWPGPDLVERLRSPVPLLILAIGVIAGLFAAAIVSRQ